MIKLCGVKKCFDGKPAIEDLDLTVMSGGICGIAGSNGAGKSTLLRLMTGVYKQDAGTIVADGEPVWENPTVKARIAYVPDEVFFEPGVNIKSLIKTNKLLYPAFDAEKCEAYAKEFEFDIKKSVSSFSKGMKRQVALISALCRQPDYYFFDETFDGLDPVMRLRFKNLINEDVINRGASAILTSHSLREFEDVCDRLAIIHKGKIVYENAADEIKSSVFKVQVAYGDIRDRAFDGLEILDIKTEGKVYELTVKGNKDDITEILKKTTPVLLDISALSLEEFFIYELGSLGYGEKSSEGDTI